VPRHAPDPTVVARALASVASGQAIAEVARDIGVSPSTIAVWRRRFGGASTPAVPSPVVLREPPLPDALVELAVELESAGLGDRAALCRRASDALRTAGTPTVRVDATNAVETAYEMLTAMVSDARAAVIVGNYTAASKTMASASKLLNDVERLRSRTAGDDDVITVTRRDLAEAERALDDYERVALAGPLVCERCGVEIRTAWAEER